MKFALCEHIFVIAFTVGLTNLLDCMMHDAVRSMIH